MPEFTVGIDPISVRRGRKKTALPRYIPVLDPGLLANLLQNFSISPSCKLEMLLQYWLVPRKPLVY